MRVYSRRLRAAAGLAALAIAAAGCGGAQGNSGTAGASGVLTVTTGSTSPFEDVFNPYSPAAALTTAGMIYEPLFYFNTANAAQVDPWLATSYKWSNAGKSITFTLRSGVRWSDGKPFTSADVAFTFNLEKANPGANPYGLKLLSAATPNARTVTLNFADPEYTNLYYIAGQTVILPQHIWSKQAKPTTWADPKPVGTGAYEVASVTPQVMTLTANPHYYQAGLPKIKTMRFLTYKDNNAILAALASGQLDWAGAYIPNIQKNYLSKNSKFTMINIPLATEFFVPNLRSGPASALPVRQAISASLNRSFIRQTVYQGNVAVSNPEALLTPNFSSVLDPSLSGAKLPATANPAQARQILQKAGYKLGSNGMFDDPDGKQLEIQLQVVATFTNYVQEATIAQQELKAAGIDLVLDPVSLNVFDNNLYSGKFQMMLDNFGYSPSPYFYYYNLLSSHLVAKPGMPDYVGNFGGYSNQTVDSALAAIAATTNKAAQQQSFNQIEEQFIKDVPLIPLWESQDEQEFNGNVVTGMPTSANSYAAPAIYLRPDNGWVAMRLSPVKG